MNIISVNVNGVRASAFNGAAAKRNYGLLNFIDRQNSRKDQKIDILCMQELRADKDQLEKFAEKLLLNDQNFYFQDDQNMKGHAGVGVIIFNQSYDILEVRTPFERQEYTSKIKASGRIIELDIKTDLGNTFTLINAYLHHADSPTVKGISREQSVFTMDNKHIFLDKLTSRLKELISLGNEIVMVGDFNIAHQNIDLKNHQGNKTKAGFLPEERAWLDLWFADINQQIPEEIYNKHFYNPDIEYFPPEYTNKHFKDNGIGLIDICRKKWGDKTSYSWWTYMGKAFDNDAGWRIDYQVATPKIANTVLDANIIKQDNYNSRYTDHAPVSVVYNY